MNVVVACCGLLLVVVSRRVWLLVVRVSLYVKKYMFLSCGNLCVVS